MIEFAVGSPGLFWVVEDNSYRIYSQAGELDGVPVFGRGVRLPVTMTSRAETPIEVRAIEVSVVRHAKYQPTLRYDKLVLPAADGRMPLLGPPHRVALGETELHTGRATVPGVRCVLGPGSAGQFEVVVEAAAAGLWRCELGVHVVHDGAVCLVEPIGPFLILLRGR